MNTILQKRIEAESNKYMEEAIEMNGVVGDNLHYKDLKTCFIEAADFALQNQWISVEEGLPEVDGHGYSKPVLIMSDTNELLVATYSKIYDKWNNVDPISYHRLVVTHWMPIPSLKGGEK